MSSHARPVARRGEKTVRGGLSWTRGDDPMTAGAAGAAGARGPG